MISDKRSSRTCIIILIFILFTIFSNASLIAAPQTWNEEWSFNQKIEIPIDTSTDNSLYQPIDMTIIFDSPCWARNEIDHSIRICCMKDDTWYELESQIYDLKYTDNDHIERCNIIFLIPTIADGSEEYFIFYDETETSSVDYTDHITIDESSYFYEPISGYPLQSDYYEIRDDDIITYMISYDGEFMGYNTCQHVYKMIDGTTELLPKNAELFAAFDFKYCYDDGLFEYSSTSQKLVSKDVVTDGNLMSEIKIESVSKRDDLKTIASYKYYHCPGSTKQIHVHVKHEALKDIMVYDQAKTDGSYLSIQAGGVKSKSIEELNIGEILPVLHFSNERNTTVSYPLDIDPEYIKDNPDIRLISIKDDIDLSDDAWVSFDEGDSGKVHALFIHYDESDFSATDEKTGLQINAFQMDYPHLAGLENNIATVQIGRNSVEDFNNHDLRIPKDFIFEYDAAFFSSIDGGFPKAKASSTLFKKLAQIKPKSTNDTIQELEEFNTYDLTVFVHNEPSFPFGSSLSAALGLNFSYLTVELYKFDKFVYSQNAIRLPLNALDLDEENVIKKIVKSFSVFDFRNSSLFKKAVFADIEEGTYLVKVFKEHPLILNDKTFIGYEIIDLKSDDKVRVYSKKESYIDINLFDQDQNSISDSMVLLQDKGITINSAITDENGFLRLHAPMNYDEYDLIVIYSDIIVYRDTVELPYFPKLNPLKKQITIDRYDLELIVKDSWDQTPFVDIQPTLLIQDNGLIASFKPDLSNEKIIFENLPANTYDLSLTYNAFTYEERINLTEDKTIQVDFLAEFPISISIRDRRGEDLKDTNMIIKREKDSEQYSGLDSDTIVSLPPGEYLISIYEDQELIGKQMVQVYGDKQVFIITNRSPSYPLIAGIILIVGIVCYFGYSYLRNNRKYLMPFIIISLLLFSLVLPWWELQGSTDDITTSTTLYLIPKTMISTFETSTSITGENAFLPDEIHLLFNAILIATILVSILLIITHYTTNKPLLTNKIRVLLMLSILLLLTASLGGFFIALNEVSRISVGSIIGSGTISFGVPGENELYNPSCYWGLSIGFYLYLLSFLLVAGPSIYKWINRLTHNEP